LLGGLSLLLRLNIEPQTQQAMAQTLIGWRQELGPAQFDLLWGQVTDEELPEWLKQAPEQEQSGWSVEEWVKTSVQAARTHSPQGEQLFELAGKLAADPNAPGEQQALAKVLRTILTGDFQPDLSGLTEEYRLLVEQALSE